MRSYRFYRVADPGAPFGRVAQLAEHSTLNRQVVGSIPTASTISDRQFVTLASALFSGVAGFIDERIPLGHASGTPS
jgi:hypothetical protein